MHLWLRRRSPKSFRFSPALSWGVENGTGEDQGWSPETGGLRGTETMPLPAAPASVGGSVPAKGQEKSEQRSSEATAASKRRLMPTATLLTGLPPWRCTLATFGFAQTNPRRMGRVAPMARPFPQLATALVHCCFFPALPISTSHQVLDRVILFCPANTDEQDGDE